MTTSEILNETILAEDINTGAVESSEIADGTIMNIDVNNAAAISFSKLASLPSADILVGSAGNVATAVEMSGDVHIDNLGVTTIQADAVGSAEIINNAVTTAKISDANVTVAKLVTSGAADAR